MYTPASLQNITQAFEPVQLQVRMQLSTDMQGFGSKEKKRERQKILNLFNIYNPSAGRER
jgi:hypothetical protein